MDIANVMAAGGCGAKLKGIPLLAVRFAKFWSCDMGVQYPLKEQKVGALRACRGGISGVMQGCSDAVFLQEAAF